MSTLFYIGLSSSIFLLLIILLYFFLKKKKVSELKNEAKIKPLPPLKDSFKDRLKLGLTQSRNEVWGKLSSLFKGELNNEKLESLEELLYGADIGTSTVAELIKVIHQKIKNENLSEESFKAFLFQFLKEKLDPIQNKSDSSFYDFKMGDKKETKVIMIVGVNGAGKTTTVGKLACRLREMGASVVVSAGDTFRAAAVDQLQIWCDRAQATMVRAKEGSSPSGVGYEALQKAINEKADYCILDTAGRLHTKENLMDELVKGKNVLKKLNPSAPHQILLVIDAISGQNALKQAHEFHRMLDLTGLIFTKCDGSSKAGSAVSIVDELKIPIAFIGVGEGAEDLDIFVVDDYLKALLGT